MTEDLKGLDRDALLARAEELATRNIELERRVVELYTLYSVSRNLSVSLQLDELFRIAMETIAISLGMEQFFMVLLDEETGELLLQAYHGLTEEQLVNLRFQRGEGFVGRVAENGEMALAGPVELGEEHTFLGAGQAGPLLALPLKAEEDTVIGVLVAHKPSGEPFTDRELGLFGEVARQVANAIHKARIYQRTQELSNRDSLTGIFNRRYLFERLEREVERGRRYARTLSLLVLDIDNFQQYNDIQGQQAGDDALRVLARIMGEGLRKPDLLARFGGEEFVVLLPETRAAPARAVAEKLRRLVAAAEIPGRESLPKGMLTVTVGVATFPDDAPEALLLISEADRALYEGKNRGRDMVVSASEIEAEGATRPVGDQ